MHSMKILYFLPNKKDDYQNRLFIICPNIANPTLYKGEAMNGKAVAPS